jgi:hypothetical protein
LQLPDTKTLQRPINELPQASRRTLVSSKCGGGFSLGILGHFFHPALLWGEWNVRRSGKPPSGDADRTSGARSAFVLSIPATGRLEKSSHP